MSQTLYLGIATKIYIKKEPNKKLFFKSEVMEQMNQYLNTSLYDISEEGNQVVLTIKETLFFKHIDSLLKEEFSDLEVNIKETEGLEDCLKCIKNARNVEEIEKIIREKECTDLFYVMGNSFETISYMNHQTEKDSHLCITIDMLAFTSTYPTYLDDGGILLHYLLTKIRESSNNPLKDDIFFLSTV